MDLYLFDTEFLLAQLDLTLVYSVYVDLGIFIEISLIRVCNNRLVFCSVLFVFLL